MDLTKYILCNLVLPFQRFLGHYDARNYELYNLHINRNICLFLTKLASVQHRNMANVETIKKSQSGNIILVENKYVSYGTVPILLKMDSVLVY